MQTFQDHTNALYEAIKANRLPPPPQTAAPENNSTETQSLSHKAAANSLLNLGNIAIAQRDYITARNLLEQAATMAKSNDDRWLTANVLNNLGEAARIQGDYKQAERRYEESQVLFRKIGSKADVARSLDNLGYVAQHRGDNEQTKAHFQESLAMFQQLGNKRGMVECLAGLAVLMVASDQLQRAARLLAAAEAQIQASGASW